MDNRKILLSRSAYEGLAIIAYKQPVSKLEIETIRGVESGSILNTLIKHDLIYVKGRAKRPGRPLLFGTTKIFLQKFGSWVVRQFSGTQVPDATSGFRAYSREAAMQLNVVSEFTYTIETIISAGRKNLAITHVPVKTNAKLRDSRLFPNIRTYVQRSVVTILKIYSNPKPLCERIPTLRLLTRDPNEIHQTAKRIIPALKAKLGKTYSIKIEPCQSQIGSGALPTEKIPSVALKISLKMKRGSGKSLNGLSKIFRELPKPVIGRIQDNAFWMDLRCLEKNHEDTFLKQLNKMIII